MIYVARQNLISTAHVDLNCGKTVSRAPQTGSPPPTLAISPRGLLTVRCHREHTESGNRHRRLTLSVYQTPLDVAQRGREPGNCGNSQRDSMYSENIFQQEEI